MRTIWLALALAAAALAGGLGCAGTDVPEGKPADDWVADVCDALSGWKVDIVQLAQEFGQELQSATSVAEARAAYVHSLDAAIAATERLVHELEAAGNPAVSDGQEIARRTREEFARDVPIFKDARAKIAALPDDPQAFTEGVKKSFVSIEQQIEGTGERLEGPEGTGLDSVEQAMANDGTCQRLGFG
jgi:hypothetical protein